MSMQVSKVWWDGDKLMAEPINAADVYKPEPVTEWLTCPKCNHKSPYSPIKAKTLAEDAERITRQARQALAEQAAQQQCEYCKRGLKAGVCYCKPAQQQEPVAKVRAKADRYGGTFVQQYSDLQPGTLLYTSPPARKPWVGLTDDEVLHTLRPTVWAHVEGHHREGMLADARAIEAKLREKNA